MTALRTMNTRINILYSLNGIVLRNTPNASTLTFIDLNASWIRPTSSPIQVDMIARPAIGAAVASITNASFCLDMFILSNTGLIIGPTISELA